MGSQPKNLGIIAPKAEIGQITGKSMSLNSGQLLYMYGSFYWLDLFIWCIFRCTRSPKPKFPWEVPYSLVNPDTSFLMVFGLLQIEKWTNLGPKS